MNDQAIAVLSILNQEQFDFIEKEFGYTREFIGSMSDDEIDAMYDQIADIEIDETVDADRENRDLTQRGKLAEGIITVMGNKLYRPDNESDAYE